MEFCNHFSSPSLPGPAENEGSSFLHELHCIGSLPSVLRHFTEATGWQLTYHCADSAPYFLRNRDAEGKPVSLTEKCGCTSLPTKLSPQILEEIASEENVWIPIDIKSEFHTLLNLPGPGLDEIFMQSTDERCKSLDFLNSPIGFLHLFRNSEPKIRKNPSKSPFYGSSTPNFHFEITPELYPIREISFREAYRCAGAIRDFIAEMQCMRVHLWLLEIDGTVNSLPLENCTPLQNAEFAGRFSQLLDYICKALHMDAIGIYLFDAKKQTFKLRASCGLSLDSLTHEIRTLDEAHADWRAFHAKSVFDLDSKTSSPDYAHMIPEGFPSGICCPLEANGTCFGSIWFLSSKNRLRESAAQLAEIATELLATMLEREAFLRRHGRAMEYHSEIKEAANLQKIQNPIQIPQQDNFDLAGSVRAARMVRNPYSISENIRNERNSGYQAASEKGENYQNQEAQSLRQSSNSLKEEAVSGDFYDWIKLPNGQTLVTLGSVGISGLQGAIIAGSVRTAIRAHARHSVSVTEIMSETHHTLWHQFAGSARISLFCGILNVEGPFLAVHFANAGTLRGVKIFDKGLYDTISLNQSDSQYFLGGSTQFHCFEDSLYLRPNQALVVFNDGLRPYWKPKNRLESQYDEETLNEILTPVLKINSHVNSYMNSSGNPSTGSSMSSNTGASTATGPSTGSSASMQTGAGMGVRSSTGIGSSTASSASVSSRKNLRVASSENSDADIQNMPENENQHVTEEQKNIQILHDLVMEDLLCAVPNVRTGEYRPYLSELEKAREHAVNQEIGRLLSCELNPTAQLMATQVRNYFCRHVTLPGKDQSTLVIRYGKPK
ncbi:MAG: SpoIIE family protein phosphatase [Planctomycetia bacterium]|nr:SpoIIE family protein phosphatase [Planctomycetia bacterium]